MHAAYISACGALKNSQVTAAGNHYSLTIDQVSDRYEQGKTLGEGEGIAAYYSHPFTPGTTPEPSLAEVDALLRANAPALDTLRAGFHADYREIPIRSFSTLLPHYAIFCAMARFLQLDAAVKRAHGDWNGAMTDGLDGLHFGGDIPRGGDLIGMLVGIAVQAVVRRDMWQEVAHLNAAQARAAAQRLAETVNAQQPFAETLQDEKWSFLAGMLELFHQQNWRKTLLTTADGDYASQPPLSSYTISKRQIISDYTQYMDAQIALARLPYQTGRPEPPLPKDPVTRALAPVFGKADFKYTSNQTQNVLLAVSLALHAYALEHGQFPATLRDLTPSYLQAIPADPFAAGADLHYRRQGSGYTLYSVGPDGKDNGGTPCVEGRTQPRVPIKQQSKQQTNTVCVTTESKGDIVAGINTR